MGPSRWWYGVAAAVAVLGVVAGALFAVRAFTDFQDRIDDFDRVDAGQRTEVRLDDGGYTIYLETPGADQLTSGGARHPYPSLALSVPRTRTCSPVLDRPVTFRT